MALEGKIKTPFGEMDKKWALGGLVVAGGVVTVAYIRHRNAAANSASDSTNSSGTSSATTTGCSDTDPAGNVGCIDPATGYVYGSPQDQANAQGSGVQDYSSGYGSMPYGYGGFGDTGFPGGGAGGDCFDSGGNLIPCPGTGTGTNPTPTTKEEWVQNCISAMNADPGTFETLAAKIFAHLSVSTANKQSFLECVALTNAPPGGYPSPIRTTDTPHHPQTGTVTVPKVTGQLYDNAAKDLQAKGLVPRRAEPDVGEVTHQNPAAGHKVKKGTAVVLSGKGSPNKKPHK